MSWKKRLVSFVLALCMVVLMLPTAAFAEEDGNFSKRYTVLVLDTSASINFVGSNDEVIYTADSAIDYVKQAAQKFLSDLSKDTKKENYVAVVPYAEEAEVVTDFTTDTELASDSIGELEASSHRRSIYEGLTTADELLSNISDDEGVTKNVVLVTTGMTDIGEYDYSGHYDDTVVGGSWENSSTEIRLYAYANAAYNAAEKVKEQANLYTLGMFQTMKDMPEEGKNVAELFRLTAKDLATSEDYFYEVTDINNLEFIFGEVGDDIVNDELSDEQQDYVNQHADFVSNGSFRKSMDNRYAEIIYDGLNTPCGNGGETLYKILNSGSEITKCKTLSIFENPYDAILIDLIASQTNTELKSFELEFNEEFIDQVGYVETLCEMHSGDWEKDTEFKTSLKKLLEDPENMKEKNPAFYELCSELFKNVVKDEKDLNKWLDSYQKAGDLIDILNKGANIVEWFSDCAKYNSAVEAFCATSNQFKATLIYTDGLMAGEFKDGFDGTVYAESFDAALNKYLQFTESNLSDKDIANMLFQEYFENGIVRVTDVFGEAVTTQAIKWTSLGLGISKASANWIYAAIEAYDIGWSISEAITSNGEIMDCRELLRANYYMERALTEFTERMAESLNKDQTYKNAKNFDAAFQVLKETEIYSLATYSKYLDIQQSSFIRWVFNTHFKGNKAEIDLATLLTEEWKNTHCHSEFKQGNRNMVKICCPTDVTICDSNNQEVLRIEDNKITYRAQDVAAYVTGDSKIISVPDLSKYTIRVIATGDGMMSYLVDTYNSNYNTTSATYYDNISIKKGNVYIGTAETVEDGINTNLTFNSAKQQPTYQSNDGKEMVYVKGISLDKNVEELKVGKELKVNVTLKPVDATSHTVVWSTSNADVAKVNEQGVVTGIGIGTAIIRCSATDGSGVYADCTVKVVSSKAKPVTEIFSDIYPSAWYIDYVQFVYDNGLMTGTSKTTFEPETTLSRAMVAQVLYNYDKRVDSPYRATNGKTFKDVSKNDWFYEAIQWASANGIASGVGNGYFEPNSPVTREQVAQFLYNYNGRPSVSGNLPFSDADKVSGWAKNAMLWAYQNKLINGTTSPDGGLLLDPQGGATRAQAAAILTNYMKNMM